MSLAEAGFVFMGLILYMSGSVSSTCWNETCAKGRGCCYHKDHKGERCIKYIKMKFSSEIVREGQSVNLTCNTCELSPNTTYSFYWNGQHLKTLQNQNQLVLKAVRSHQEGSYSCSAKTGENKISSDPKFLNVINTSENQLQAAAAVGAGAAALVMIPVMIFIWFRVKGTLGHCSTAEGTENTEQLDGGHVYENIPAQPSEQDDLYYSTLQFSPTVQPHHPREDEHAAYTVVNFRQHV
ncbi:carcinoembryonic antigen-related cell adhesion molecule 1-like [Anabas testudineus]|uniref:carcinoembryonic antigen-related cell adhesion molecule 1-like n=1 Tax=Anabas testudineus TaxID=64144 RepID=UPI000E461065|nr:carcinoembryonic antigen-related cell adhesion molecule 1-like [Anabas testudineus]